MVTALAQFVMLKSFLLWDRFFWMPRL